MASSFKTSMKILKTTVKVAKAVEKANRPPKQSRPKFDADDYSWNINIDEDDGTENIEIYGPDDELVEDEAICRKVMRSEDFKDELDAERQCAAELVNDETTAWTEIAHRCQPIPSKSLLEHELQNLKEPIFRPTKFKDPEPTAQSILPALTAEAKSNTRTWKFWAKSSLQSKYISDHSDSFLAKAIAEWNTAKNLHESTQANRYQARLEEYHSTKRGIETQIKSISKPISEQIHTAFDHIISPMDFSIDIEIDGNQVTIELDLPEIEDIPERIAVFSTSGKLTIRDKNSKELQKDYATSVIGLAFYFAYRTFDFDMGVDRVTINGYTQRANKKTEEIQDDYVYSITFDRDRFSQMDLSQLDPIESVKHFDPQMSISTTFALKTIKLAR